MSFSKITKKILNNITPPIILRACIETKLLVRRIIFSGYSVSNLIKNNWGVKAQVNKNCIILCNGPSLNKSLKDHKLFIENSIKICVNFMPLSYFFQELKPEFLMLVDPIFWQKNISAELESKIIKLNDALRCVDWNLKIVMPIKAKVTNHVFEVAANNKNIEMIFINSDVSKSDILQKRLFEYAANRSAPVFQSVSIAAIYFAINSGFKNIYLFGCDHDWIKNMIVDDNNRLCHRDTHFYEENETTKFLPINSSLLEEFRAQYSLHFAYNELKEYAKFMNSDVFNATPNSLLDSFERVDLRKMN